MTPDLILEITKALKDTRQFVAAQAPDVVQQYLGYATAGEIGALVGAVVFLVIGALGLLYAVTDEWNEIGPVLCGLFGGVAFLICCSVIVCSATTLYQIKHYPKGYLLDSLASHHGCKS